MPIPIDFHRWNDLIEQEEVSSRLFANKSAFYEAVNRISEITHDLKARYGMTITTYAPLRMYCIDSRPLAELYDAVVTIRCNKGHHFVKPWPTIWSEMYNYSDMGDDPVCTYCRRSDSRYARLQYGDARVTLSMIHHERGEEIILDDTFVGMGKKYNQHSLEFGFVRIATKAAVDNTYRSYIKKADRLVYHAHDDEYAFVWAGQLSPDSVKNPFIAAFMREHAAGLYYEDPIYPVDADYHNGEKGTFGILTAIKELRENGAKVLNAWGNDAYLKPGKYNWGDTRPTTIKDAALDTYIKEQRQLWLDWQTARVIDKNK